MSTHSSFTLHQERKHFYYALVIPVCFMLLFLLMYLLQLTFPVLTTRLAIYPRQFSSLLGIVTGAMVHGSWSHLLGNLLTFGILSSMLFYLFKDIAWEVFVQMWIYSALLLWLIGRPSYHIGASGLIFSLAFFLFTSGIIRHQRHLLATALVIVFLYGGMVWQLFPWEATVKISWESHLSGAIVGLCLAVVYRHRGPQPLEPMDDDDLDDSNPYWMVDGENTQDDVVDK